MSATLALPEPRSFSLRHFLLRYLFLGVPLAIWALAFVLIAIAAHFDMPAVTFGAQELVVPF